MRVNYPKDIRLFPDLPPRFQQSVQSGQLKQALRLARHPHGRGQLNPDEEFVDPIFANDFVTTT